MSWSKISRGNFATVVIISLDLTLAVACGTARESETPSEGLTTATQQPANQQSAAQPTVAQLASGGAVPTTVLQPTPAGDGTMAAAPMGTLNTGLKETGRFFLHRSTFPSVLEVEGAQQLMVPNAVETGLRISTFNYQTIDYQTIDAVRPVGINIKPRTEHVRCTERPADQRL